jgi:uncharacterized protein (DUF58 family)
LRDLRLRRRLDAPLFAQTPARLEMEVENHGPGPVIAVSLQDRGPGHCLVRFIPRLRTGDKARFCQEITLPRRGWYDGVTLRAGSGYPLGLAERAVSQGPVAKVVVYPRLADLNRGRLRRFLSQAVPSQNPIRRRPCRHPAALSEFHGLRTFRPGDSPRLIHWRTSARCGELMVREFEEMPTDNLLLVLDPWLAAQPLEEGPRARTWSFWARRKPAADRDGSASREAPLEAAISMAATVCWEWCRQRGDHFVLATADPEPVVLDGITGRAHALRMLACLALVKGGPAPDLDGLLSRLATADLPPAPVLLVSTRGGDFADALARRLNRSVARLDATAGASYDFFEGLAQPAR